MKKLLLSFSLFSAICSQAQTNLVVNPSFEDYTKCPTGFGTIGLATAINYNTFTFPTVNHWVVGTQNGTPDYFNSCATSNFFKTPSNLFGNVKPRTGDAYAGLWSYDDGSANSTNKEYLHTRLAQPMIAGHTYRVSYYVNLGTKSDNGLGQRTFRVSGIDYMGALFSDTFYCPSVAMMTEGSGIINPAGRYLTDTLGWTLVSGEYKAKGNEQWMTIGAFKRAQASTLPGDTVVWDANLFSKNAYYFVDDVCVIDMDSPQTSDQEFNVCSIDTALTFNSLHADGALSYLWNTGDTTASVQAPAEKATYWVRTIADCAIYIDTFRITGALLEKPIVTVNVDTLGTQPGYTSYQWMWNGELIEGATANTYKVGKNGDYQVIVTNAEGCTDTSDVYTVTNTIIATISLSDQITIYPNPAESFIHIQSPVFCDIVLSSVTGQAILSARDAQTLSIQNLPTGIYLVKVYDKDRNLIKVSKLLKQ